MIPDEREKLFIEAAVYVDARGYLWQRLRNGQWRSTDGCRSRVTGQGRWAAEPPEDRGPYVRVELVPVVCDPAVGVIGDQRCCDLHGRHCEPPGDLCCGDCTEGQHPWHAPGVRCVLEAP